MTTQIQKRRGRSTHDAGAPAPRLFSVDEYYCMAEAGILRPDERLELLAGVIYAMAAMGSRHATSVRDFDDWFHVRLVGQAIVSVQCPIHLDDGSAPEPDVAIVRLREDRYRTAHPGPADVLLLIEVADSSPGYDRDLKLPQYAAASIPEVWIVDLRGNRVFVCRGPQHGQYTERHTVGREGTLSPQAFPN